MFLVVLVGLANPPFDFCCLNVFEMLNTVQVNSVTGLTQTHTQTHICMYVCMYVCVYIYIYIRVIDLLD